MCSHSRQEIEGENASGSIETYFPQLIIEEILSRLPVKSLLKFRCVSKSWCSLIGSERFIKIHLQNSTKNTSLSHHRMIFNLLQHPQRLLLHCSWRSLLNEPAVNPFAYKDLFNVQWESIKLVGCCNGLVCFLLNRQYFFLWNPSTKMSKILPDAYHTLYGNIISKYGFGYDKSSNDYKVLVTLCHMNTPNQVIRRVFSLKTNSWRTLKYEDGSSQHFGGAGKFASGNLHWHRAVGGQDWEIVSFDLKKCEAFEIVEQPNYSRRPHYQSLGVIEGCLGLFCVYRNSHAEIWVMKQYRVKESWVKMVTLPHVYYFSDADILSLLFFRGPNGEVVIFYKSGFLIYNPKDRVYRYSPICIIGSVEDADLYVESLVSLDADAEAEQER